MNLSLISKIIRKYPVLVVCGLIVPLALVLTSMRSPKIQEYQDQKSIIEKRWREIGINKDRSASLNDDFQQLTEGVQQIQERLMNVEAVAANYEVFYDLEEKAGIKLESFSLGMPFDGSGLAIPKGKLTHYSAVPCQFSMSGSLSQLLSFIDLLDRNEFIIRMELLSVRVSSRVIDTADQDGKLSATMRCYVLADKNEK